MTVEGREVSFHTNSGLSSSVMEANVNGNNVVLQVSPLIKAHRGGGRKSGIIIREWNLRESCVKDRD